MLLPGMVSLDDLLKARLQTLEAERRRERILPLRLVFAFGRERRTPANGVIPNGEDSIAEDTPSRSSESL